MELALLRARLDAFEQRFYKKAGSMYVKFDEVRREAARLKSRFEPAAHREYVAALEQGKLSVADCQRALTKAPPDAQKLRRLHVELARLFHPDLAVDPVRRSLCEQLMTEINIAVQDADTQRLESIRDTIGGDADAAQEMAELTRSVPFQLNARNQYALRQQQDLLTDLTAWVYAQADQALRNLSHNQPTRLFPNLMLRALEDLQSVSIRLLHFPKDYSLGELSVRAERNIDSPRTVLGEARGGVRVPFAKALILRIGKACKSLEALRVLDSEDINGFIDEWPDFVELTDEMLLPLTTFNRLEELNLARTKITGRVFDAFPPLRELRSLILDETAFDDHGMQRLAESIWMQRLDLSSTRVTGRGLAAMNRMKSLRDLSLHATPIEDGDLAVLDFLPQLRNLNLGLTRITDAAMERISRLSQLEVLHLGGTQITDRSMEWLAELPMLRDLVLWETKLSAAGLKKLTQCRALRYLDADQTNVTRQDLVAFRNHCPEVKLPSDIWSDSAEIPAEASAAGRAL
jgi:hypothetical protein